nr:hypothetical protein [uncultured Desulfobacter sp.]
MESRVDGTFFNKNIVSLMAFNQIKFTASGPFARFSELKQVIETCESWSDIDKTWSYFESQWKPKSWNDEYRVVCTRKKVKKPQKKPTSA